MLREYGRTAGIENTGEAHAGMAPQPNREANASSHEQGSANALSRYARGIRELDRRSSFKSTPYSIVLLNPFGLMLR